jgi:hypothetical protein
MAAGVARISSQKYRKWTALGVFMSWMRASADDAPGSS